MQHFTHAHGRIWLAVSAVALAIALFAPGRAAGQEEVDVRRPLAADGALYVSNMAGSLTIIGWDRNEVHITGELGRAVEKLLVSGDEEQLEVEVKIDEDRHRGAEAELELHVPAGCRIDVESISADCELSEFSGRASFETVSGDFTARGTPERLEATSVSGDLDVVVSTGRLELQTVSGDISLEVEGGEVGIETVSGDCEVIGGSFASIDFSSVSGDLDLEGALSPRGSFDFETHSGELQLHLPSETSAEFTAASFSGDIETDFATRDLHRRKQTFGQELSFSVGDGEAAVRIETFSGDVDISAR